MTVLIRLLDSVGLVVGVVTAGIWHWARSTVRGGWTLYAPLNGPLQLPVQHPGW